MINNDKKTRKTPLLIGVFVLAGALILAACGQGSAPTQGAAENEVTTAAGRPAPDFTLTVYQGEEVLGGEEVQFSEVLAEGQPVVLNFWAGLCPPCRIEMPDLQSVYRNKSGQFVLIGIDVGPFTNLGSREDGRQLLQNLGVDYPTGTTFDQSVMEGYQVLGMPSTYFITPDGQIHESWSGLLTESKFEELVDELIEVSG